MRESAMEIGMTVAVVRGEHAGRTGTLTDFEVTTDPYANGVHAEEADDDRHPDDIANDKYVYEVFLVLDDEDGTEIWLWASEVELADPSKPILSHRRWPRRTPSARRFPW